ncbi:kinase-like domain-containing protein [Mycena leptocephala]|nr:kinase-like domain-containing protein [Mycena leptocephala]
MQPPPPLPTELQPPWTELDEKDAPKIWQHYAGFLLERGYHIMRSEEYLTLGKGAAIPPPALNPFQPKDSEFFVHPGPAPDLLSTRTFSDWQPGVNICFGIGSFQRPVVFKAVLHQTTELAALRVLESPSLRTDKRNCLIPVLDFLHTPFFIIVVMPVWGFDWNSPPCGNTKTRHEMSIKLTKCLEFFHEKGIAHGDIHPHNILLSQADRRDFAEQAPEKEFRLSCAVEYAFIDLGSACMFKPGAPPVAQAITVPPKSVRAPEQTEDCDEPINLFAADVYNLGKTLELELSAAIQHYGGDRLAEQNLEAYRNILSAMTDPQPSTRLTAAQAAAALSALQDFSFPASIFILRLPSTTGFNLLDGGKIQITDTVKSVEAMNRKLLRAKYEPPVRGNDDNFLEDCSNIRKIVNNNFRYM